MKRLPARLRVYLEHLSRSIRSPAATVSLARPKEMPDAGRYRARAGALAGRAAARAVTRGMALRYLEDYPVGSTAELGSVLVTEDEIRAFAERYDPQPFHTDPEKAKHWPYGGLIASGWHTAAMMMRVMVDEFIDGEVSLGSPGLGPIRWKLPVRPGDVLRVRARVTDVRVSRSKPDRGTLTFVVDVVNQADEIVMTVDDWLAIMRTRPHADG